MSESATEEVSVEEIKSSDEYQSLKQRIEDLEDQIQDHQQHIEELQRDGREQEMYDQFNQESNFGY